MARGQIPEPGLPSEQPRPVSPPYESNPTTPETFGAGLAAPIARAGHVASEVFLQAKESADTTAVLGAIGQAKQALNDIILDPEKGYAGLKGADAIAGRDKALQMFGSKLEEIAGDLQGPDQQQAFRRHALAIQEQGYMHAISHETVQMEDVARATFQGAADQTARALQSPQVIASPKDRDQQLADLLRLSTAEALRRFGRNASADAVQSVVGPAMQKAAVDAMNAAIVSNDPAIARDTFDRVGPLLGTHERQFAGMVGRVAGQQQVKAFASAILDSATSSVIMPGTDLVVPRIDEVKLSVALANLKDQPLREEIEKDVERRRADSTKIWNAVVGTVYQRVEAAAQKEGGFDLSRASGQDLEWLRQFAPEDRRKLTGFETRQDKAESAEAWSALAADMANPGRKAFYSNMTVPEFTRLTVDQGLAPPDRIKAVKLFGDVLNGAQTEKVNATVREQLLAALPNSPPQREKLQGPLLDATSAFIDKWKAASEGKGPTTEQIRAFINRELVVGGPWYSRLKRIQFESDLANAGKTFEPAGTDIALPVPPAAAAQYVVPGQAIPQLPTSTPVQMPAQVRIRTPKGATKLVPREQLDEALKQGATLAP